ncbi:hypothetical protein HanPI659440_Chr14g0565871 [Helianthus annuus]|nr:hypothetical protein HanPI659440_Chr14g0565871 [Helianthus annuus]
MYSLNKFLSTRSFWFINLLSVCLVQRFHFSSVGPKRFHRCRFRPLG